MRPELETLCQCLVFWCWAATVCLAPLVIVQGSKAVVKDIVVRTIASIGVHDACDMCVFDVVVLVLLQLERHGIAHSVNPTAITLELASGCNLHCPAARQSD
jgi:hypothetical protein